MRGKCVHKEQCLSYPATKLCILTRADSGVSIPNVGAYRESHFMLHTYEVMLIEGKDAGHRYAHMTTVQFVLDHNQIVVCYMH